MAGSTVVHAQAILQALTPYEHQLNYSGTACAPDCPACRWNRRTSDAPWSRETDDSGYVTKALQLYWEQCGNVEDFADLDTDVQSAVLQVAQRLKQSH